MQIYFVKLKNSTEIEVEKIRYCSLSNGIRIGLFRSVDKRAKYSSSYLLIVKRRREFLHQLNFLSLFIAVQII